MATEANDDVDTCRLTSGSIIRVVSNILPEGFPSGYKVYLVEVVSAPLADKFPDSPVLCRAGQKLAISRSTMSDLRAMSYAVKKFSKIK